MKYTAEEVRAIAKRLHDDITGADGDALMASDMLTAYAERIEADEMAADYPECSGDPASCPENEGFGCCKAHAETITLRPPAQAAQVESDADMAKQVLAWMTRTGSLSTTWGDMAALSQSAAEPVVHGEVCKICGKDTPHHHLRGTAPTPAPSIDLAAVREVIAALRSVEQDHHDAWADKLTAALPESKP